MVSRRIPGVWLYVLACLFLAVIAVFWIYSLLKSAEAYRSPLHPQPPQPGPVTGERVARRVVFVLIDALRYDTAARPETMPFLNELRSRGAWARMESRPPSYSQPGYAVLLTGAWPELSDGPVVNVAREAIPTFTQDNLFSAVHRVGLETAISGYDWFEKLVPQADVSKSFYTPGEDRAADEQVVAAALSWLEGNTIPGLVLIHLDQVDYAGHHEGGPQDPRWDAAAHRADDLLGTVASRLDLNQDVLLVASDHGQIRAGGHGGHDPETLLEPFLLTGKGVIPGDYGEVAMTDVAPTLAVLLGANLPASSQGRPRTEMLNLPTGRKAAVEHLLETQQKDLLQAYEAAVGPQVEPLSGLQDPLLKYQFALESARMARLNGERLLRLLVVGVLLGLPLAFLYRRWRRGRLSLKPLAWPLVGAGLYVLAFHARYNWIGGRPYSLSALDSPTGLGRSAGLSILIALLLAWLFVSFGSGALRQPPGRAAETCLSLVLAIQTLLFLPALWSFILNGARITWTLPDFPSLTLALFALVQVPVVAILGLILSGLSAVIVSIKKKSKIDGLNPI